MSRSQIIQALVTPITERETGDVKRLGPRQCTGTRADGERCQRTPIMGGDRCGAHGGNHPLAQQAARRLLLSMVEPAVTVLFQAIADCDIDPTSTTRLCRVHGDNGCPEWPVRVNAAKTLLSRAGYGETAKLTVEHIDEDLSKLDKGQLADELEKLSRDLRVRDAIDVTPAGSDVHFTPLQRPDPYDMSDETEH